MQTKILLARVLRFLIVVDVVDVTPEGKSRASSCDRSRLVRI
jgi:hypothetical protein